jgi:hypothetical protein
MTTHEGMTEDSPEGNDPVVENANMLGEGYDVGRALELMKENPDPFYESGGDFSIYGPTSGEFAEAFLRGLESNATYAEHREDVEALIVASDDYYHVILRPKQVSAGQ